MKQPQTHDYTVKTWGHDYATTEIIDGGAKLTLVGWGRGISKGDYLIFKQSDGSTTRYKVTKIDYKLNPSDMWSAKVKFAPRPFTQPSVSRSQG